MADVAPELLRTLSGVVIGFILASAWQVWRDWRRDSRDRRSVVAPLKSRVSNDVFFTQQVIDGLRGKNGVPPKALHPLVFFPEPTSRQVEHLGLLDPTVIRGLDQYEKAVLGAKRCHDVEVAQPSASDEVASQKRIALVATCYEAFVAVGADFLRLLDKTYPKTVIPREPQLGPSFKLQMK